MGGYPGKEEPEEKGFLPTFLCLEPRVLLGQASKHRGESSSSRLQGESVPTWKRIREAVPATVLFLREIWVRRPIPFAMSHC